MSFSLPGKRSHDRNSPDYVPSVFSLSKSHPKKINASTDRYQRYLKRQENENSLTDNESIYDIGESLLEKSVIQSSVLSSSTEDKKLMNFYTGLPNNKLSLWVFILT